MSGRTLLLGGAGFMVVFIAVLWYTQMYAFYHELSPATEITVAERTIQVSDFQGIDASTSPIKLRTCMRLDPDDLQGLAPTNHAEPLVAPYWFECFEARTIAKAMEAGEATAYLAASEEFDGSERMIAVYPDGRAYMWRQLSPEFSK